MQLWDRIGRNRKSPLFSRQVGSYYLVRLQSISLASMLRLARQSLGDYVCRWPTPQPARHTHRHQLTASRTVNSKWMFSISFNPLFCWTIFCYLVKRQSLPLKYKSLHNWLQLLPQVVDLAVCGVLLPLAPFTPCHPTTGHLMHLGPCPAAWTPSCPLPFKWSVVFLPSFGGAT